ncbi:MAG: lactonase family protein [Gemmatimonadetes bacterium]|mgnify:CR=1 FL=1|jgi:6-phosphogluconolactonase|nr:lactonase family protein [Gemmatimonadota bacterium]MBT6146547.1 lactonase family protein [Gemmatimonadota bacterium]MBT7859547.1 lactonase family protein [Gemmatimonadota bacterium]
MTDFLISSLSGEQPRITVEVIDEDGRLRPASHVDLDGGPGPLAVSPDGRQLYACVTVDGAHLARSYTIDDDGTLTQTGQTDMGASACQMSTDRTGRFLLAAYYSDGMVTVDPIDAGTLGGARTQQVPTDQCAHYIQTDASNRFAFVPHVAEANTVFQFHFDARTGQLTPNDPPRVSPGPGEGPRHLCFHPSGRYAFTDGEQGSSVTVWDVDETAGTLTPRQTLPTLPADFTDTNHCSQIHLTPNGRFLYAGNRGHHSIAGYRVAEDGSLEAASRTPADPNPRPMAISPDSRFLYAAGSTTDGRLIAWPIDSTSGELGAPTYYDCGPVYWVTACRRD